jgi:hypothetical protein
MIITILCIIVEIVATNSSSSCVCVWCVLYAAILRIRCGASKLVSSFARLPRKLENTATIVYYFRSQTNTMIKAYLHNNNKKHRGIRTPTTWILMHHNKTLKSHGVSNST